MGTWDSKETKLRGHGTGHYLTAIAQAYAGTGYDKTLQANFSEKMEYMVNALYVSGLIRFIRVHLWLIINTSPRDRGGSGD